jgi:rhodanese-related sulfurtransferase
MHEPGPSISVTDLRQWRQEGRSFALLDVREPWELDICSLAEAIAIPLQQLPQRLGELPTETPLVVMCHHGMRSLQAVLWLQRQGIDSAINLAGGIDAWAREIDPDMGVY